ncbi:MAG: hypothetical protein JOZ43_02665, partial [Acidobacteriales bacterium]|nr:hypothetical protein [Terriglobales bacterium]
MLPLALLIALQAAQPPQTPAPPPQPPVLSSNSPAFLTKRLAGVWEQPPVEGKELGRILVLGADGNATLATALMEDLNYNFDGKKLIVVDASNPEEIRESSTIVLTGDTMKETNDETHDSAEFVRITPAPPSKQPPGNIVGTWKRDTRNVTPDPSLSADEKQHRLAIAEYGRYEYKPD